MRKELHDELECLRRYASQGTVDVVSKAHMCRRIELERLEAVEQALAQTLQVFRGGTSNA